MIKTIKKDTNREKYVLFFFEPFDNELISNIIKDFSDTQSTLEISLKETFNILELKSMMFMPLLQKKDLELKD